MRPPPSTAEILEEAALRDPLRPAFQEEGALLEVGQFYGMVAQCALWLQRLGVRRGERVAIAGPGYGVQLVLLLAAEGLGAVIASFNAEADPDASFLFSQVQWVFAARPQQVPAGVRFQLLDEALARAWAQPLGQERPAWNAQALGEPQRISRTSGSTGTSKFMLLSRAAQEHWIETGREKRTFGPGTRSLMLAPLVMNAALTRCSVCLRRGGMVLAPAHGGVLPQLLPTHAWGLPMHLERLLAEAPAGWVSPHPVQVSVLGGAMAPALREQVLRVFHGWTRNRYGSNEAGAICEELDATGTGLLAPGVDVRILGPDGGELPPGEAGRIAVRTPALVDGYLERPEETAQCFQDGWFLSGDAGLLVGPRQLRLLGRQDDLLDLAGIKVPASQLEAALRAQPTIADCAVQALHSGAGAVTLGLALVLAPDARQEDVGPQVHEALRAQPNTRAQLLVLPALPRLQNGKVDRMALLRRFHQAP
ncbi:acyl--CoA ligase [Ramlibacter sp. G-1-2-2]|uniref:Acyl--CoA ligase n=1 Tax=Ramlibacter agri TaxID=2728837 RepID=A0A848HAR8_9BURK|nr:class I adenylate-forming enzyme family protein [Ramlibacter agri]NML46511.1 acyl--CoA ligase [Ramlibacter agri]